MDFLKNHCTCAGSNWGNIFHCRNLVSICKNEINQEDWDRLFDKESFFSQEDYELAKKLDETHNNGEGEDNTASENLLRMIATKNIIIPKPEVYQWLQDNVKKSDDGNEMWCIGSKETLFLGTQLRFSFFFRRTDDAMAFIRAWSKYKKPISYYHYFSGIKKELNLETMKYEIQK